VSPEVWKNLIERETAPLGLDLVVHRHENFEEIKARFGFYPLSVGNIGEMHSLLEGVFSRDFFEEAHKYDPYEIYSEDLSLPLLQGRSLVRQNQYEFISKTLPYYIFQFLGGKQEMAFGVEGRVPFLDNDIVAMASQVPTRFHLRGGQEKAVLREAFKHWIPESVYRRGKHGYSAPILAPFLGKRCPDYFFEMMSERNFSEVGLFSHKFCWNLIKRIESSAENAQQRVLEERIVVFILGAHLVHHMFIKNSPEHFSGFNY
jgi:asparagine synthase (glutamine-hydrolysing)